MIYFFLQLEIPKRHYLVGHIYQSLLTVLAKWHWHLLYFVEIKAVKKWLLINGFFIMQILHKKILASISQITATLNNAKWLAEQRIFVCFFWMVMK